MGRLDIEGQAVTGHLSVNDHKASGSLAQRPRGLEQGTEQAGKLWDPGAAAGGDPHGEWRQPDWTGGGMSQSPTLARPRTQARDSARRPEPGTGRSELQDPVHEGSVWATPSVDPTAPAPPASAPNLCLPFPPKPSPAARAVGAGASPARGPRSRLSLGSVLDWGGRRAGAEGERVSFPHPPSPQPRRPLWQGTSQGT